MRNLAEGGLRLKPRPGALAPRLRPPAARSMPVLILMTDRRRLADPEVAVRRLPPGAAVIFRDYDAPDRVAAARRLRRLCGARGLSFLVAGDWRLAVAVGADGLHLPEGLVRHGRRTWRRAWRPGFLITQAAHSDAAVARAGRRGVDAVLLSPVFATTSHPGAKPLGPLRFARLVRISPVPVYALGGMTAKTVRRLAGIAIAGFAAIDALIPPAKSQRPS